MVAHVRKYLKIGPYGLMAGCVIIVALCIRIFLIYMGWPGTNSDEATMGLMARHIAYNGEHPIFIYGQNYMGSLEAHIGATLFFIFGSSLFSLRLGLVLLYSIFLIVMYLLTSLLYSKKLALAIVILLSLGSAELLTRQLKAVGGAEETMLFGSLLVLISSWLVLSYQKDTPHNTRRKRWFLYGCFGLVMGLGMWSHLLVLPFVVASLVFLVFFCYRELNLFAIASFVFGLLMGFLPSLLFNLQHPSQNSLRALLILHTSGGTTTGVPFTLWDQIRGTILISLPVATGANPQCLVPDTPGLWRTQITSCMLVQGVWGICFLFLYGIVLLLTTRTLVKYIMRHTAITPSSEERRAMLYHAARLTLLASGGLTLLSYMLSPAPALVPLTSTRYLVGLLIMFPVLLAPLWEGIRQLCPRRASSVCKGAIDCALHTDDARRGHNQLRPYLSNIVEQGRNQLRPYLIRDVCEGALFLFIYLLYFIGILGVFLQLPAQQKVNQQQDEMVKNLIRLHDTRIYSDYWTCNVLIFQSNERIICSALNEQLQPGENRYLPYQTIVAHDPRAVYVFRTGSPQALALAQHPAHARQSYEYIEIDNYVLYKPKT